MVEKIPLLLEAACAAFAGLSFESLEYHDSGDAERGDELSDIASALAEALQACGIERESMPQSYKEKRDEPFPQTS